MLGRWSEITREHVIEAIRIYNENPRAYSRSRNTFLVYKEKPYPAKAIRGIAYRVCFGETISQQEFTGGEDTAVFFRQLGFTIERDAPSTDDKRPKVATAALKPHKGLDRRRQKNALQSILQRRFGVVVSEMKFDWLRVPSSETFDDLYSSIYARLRENRGYEHFFKKGLHLSADFYVNRLNLVIEYDESQHFSHARRIALECYPHDLGVGFSTPDWIDACIEMNSVDNTPPDRDERRAFYDSLRDIECARKGVRILRIRHGVVDWESADAEKKLMKLLEPYLQKKQLGATQTMQTVDSASQLDWRKFEIDIQRVRLNYLKCIFHFTPPKTEVFDVKGAMGAGDDFQLIASTNGRSFTLFPAGFGCIYVGGKGSVPLPSECFGLSTDLSDETSYLRDSLSAFTKAAREQALSMLANADEAAMWDILVNYWWIRLGFHEFAYDASEVIEFGSSRDYLLTVMRQGRPSGDLLSEPFTNEQRNHFIRHLMQWNRFACCTYDCGPIVVGKDGYVPYDEAAKTRRQMLGERVSSVAERIRSLASTHDFLAVYSDEPLSLMSKYGGFREHRGELSAIIADVQQKLNAIIEREQLGLPVFTYVPE